MYKAALSFKIARTCGSDDVKLSLEFCACAPHVVSSSVVPVLDALRYQKGEAITREQCRTASLAQDDISHM